MAQVACSVEKCDALPLRARLTLGRRGKVSGGVSGDPASSCTSRARLPAPDCMTCPGPLVATCPTKIGEICTAFAAANCPCPLLPGLLRFGVTFPVDDAPLRLRLVGLEEEATLVLEIHPPDK